MILKTITLLVIATTPPALLANAWSWDTINIDLNAIKSGTHSAGGGIVLSTSSSDTVTGKSMEQAICESKGSYSKTECSPYSLPIEDESAYGMICKTHTYKYYWTGSKCAVKKIS